MDWHADHPYWQHAGNGHPVLWVLCFLILAALIGLAAAFLFRWLAARNAGSAVRFVPAALGPHEDALTIVRMRYARGEIDREQFLQTSADLGGPGYQAEPPPDAPAE